MFFVFERAAHTEVTPSGFEAITASPVSHVCMWWGWGEGRFPCQFQLCATASMSPGCLLEVGMPVYLQE